MVSFLLESTWLVEMYKRPVELAFECIIFLKLYQKVRRENTVTTVTTFEVGACPTNIGGTTSITSYKRLFCASYRAF